MTSGMNLPADDLFHVLKHMRSWEKLRGKRVFLAGASGFVGTWLTQTFAYANESLSLGASLTPMPRDSLPQGNFDIGIHAAKADDVWADMVGTRRILDFAMERGVSRFLFTSSGAVYGKLPPDMTHVAEDLVGAPYPHHAPSGYAHAKRAGELLCAEYAQKFGVCTVIARLFSFVGPLLPLNANFAVGNFVRDVIAGGPVVIQGDGTSRRSYLYASDLAIWLWTLLLDGQSVYPYNVGSPESISIAELAHAVVGNSKPETEIIFKREGSSTVYVPSVERARSELDLRVRILLEEGIRRMYRWNIDSKVREMIPDVPTTT
jgi:nucleoside-diphosphate-sugar epimerase